MEVPSPIITSSSPLNSGVSFFSANYSIANWNKKNQFRHGISSSRIRRFSLSTSSRRFSTSRRNLSIFASFSRPTRRNNSLRKKLIHEQQVQHNHIPDNSNSDFQFPDRIHNDNGSSSGVGVSDSTAEQKPERLGESVLRNRLENWVDQYKKDTEFWGIGSGPIFTIFQDSNGNVDKVFVNEDEILMRSQAERGEPKNLTELNHKVSAAKIIAKEMESGKNVIARNSSVAKFVVEGEESGFLKAAQGLSFKPEVLTKFSRVGGVVLCSCFVLFYVRKLFTFKREEIEYTELEKEMMRRKIKSRKEKETLVENAGVEVIQVRAEPPKVSYEKPQFDKEELMRAIAKEKSKASRAELALEESTGTLNTSFSDLDDKIRETRDMSSDAQKIEGREDPLSLSDGNKLLSVNGKLLSGDEVPERVGDGACFPSDVPKDNLTQVNDVLKNDESELLHNIAFVETRVLHVSSSSALNMDVKNSASQIMDEMPRNTSSDSHKLKRDRGQKKPRIMRTVKEAREYLSEKRGKQKPSDEKIQVRAAKGFAAPPRLPSDKGFKSMTSKAEDPKSKLFEPSSLIGESDSSPLINGNVDSAQNDKKSTSVKGSHSKHSVEGHATDDSQKHNVFLNHECNDRDTETMPYDQEKNWIEDNFSAVEPVVKKIGVGFRDNYMVAREKSAQQVDANLTLAQLQCDSDNGEDLQWMQDDKLREIVFKVRENELANRDPFHSMDAEDKLAFFKGLEKKVESENEKMLKLHEWLHSNIENLDYGADGISLYDPPEKIIPRWKNPPFEKGPEFFDDFLEQRKAFFPGKDGVLPTVHKNEKNCSLKPTESNHNGMTDLETNDPKMAIQGQEVKDFKTIIEGSDGSFKPGKKTGKEFWQHTKKWSRGFLESYNAETDPEVKSIMKDMGKDLDRWITEKEVHEAAELITKMPERNKKFMEKKLNKLKREMELFGPQAVVSKYREYAEEKEEDYLWWLDLPHVLCIELYTEHDGEQRVGFYSLEMAADLELEPKPCHVIAFEDPGDCKNFCYIIQSHLEMLGTGNAFIVARPPKDAFREAKANGFGVTVIRKGELQLNIDQTLEEVEEQITEIGSKIYHDKIMKDRSVDISSLMKGVFGLSNKPTKRGRSKQKQKKLRKK